MPSDSWFALVTRPRHEKSAAVSLRAKGLEEFLPLQQARRRWTDRVQAIDLPLFLPVLPVWDGRYVRVMDTPGVRAVVGFGGHPVPVAATEINALQALLGPGCGVQPWPHLTADTGSVRTMGGRRGNRPRVGCGLESGNL